MARLALSLIFSLLAVHAVVAQQAPTPEEKPKQFASYDDLFDDFEKRRGVLATRYERLQEAERVEPAELARVEAQMQELDREYVKALRYYIDTHPDAKDAMPARFEVAVTLSRLQDQLDKAVLACDDFLQKHESSELVPDVRFLRAQTLFRVTGREADALKALEEFIEKHPTREEVPACRMMRVRAMLFLDRVDDARRALRVLLDSDTVKDDDDAKDFLQTQLNNLDWVGRDLPDFELTALGGDKLSRNKFAGKPLLLTFYDSTSAACLGELPFIQEAHKRFEGKLNVAGISVNESRTAFEQWVERNKEKVTFPNTWVAREADNTLVRKLNVTLIPFNVLVNADGKIYRYDVRSDDMLRYAELLTK